MAWQPCKYPHSQASVIRTHLMEKSEEWGIDATTPNLVLESKTSAIAHDTTRNDGTLFKIHPLDISARLNTPHRHYNPSVDVKRDRMTGSIPGESGGTARYFHLHLSMINNNKINPFTDVVSMNVNCCSNNLIDQGPTASRVDESCQRQEAGARTGHSVSKPGAPPRNQSTPQTHHRENMRPDQ